MARQATRSGSATAAVRGGLVAVSASPPLPGSVNPRQRRRGPGQASRPRPDLGLYGPRQANGSRPDLGLCGPCGWASLHHPHYAARRVCLAGINIPARHTPSVRCSRPPRAGSLAADLYRIARRPSPEHSPPTWGARPTPSPPPPHVEQPVDARSGADAASSQASASSKHGHQAATNRGSHSAKAHHCIQTGQTERPTADRSRAGLAHRPDRCTGQIGGKESAEG